MPVSEKEVQNLLEHRDHLTVLAGGTPSERRLVLDDPTDELVRALSTASRVAHDGGELPDTVYEKHTRKLQIAVSRNKALRTKRDGLRGKLGAGCIHDEGVGGVGDAGSRVSPDEETKANDVDATTVTQNVWQSNQLALAE